MTRDRTASRRRRAWRWAGATAAVVGAVGVLAVTATPPIVPSADAVVDGVSPTSVRIARWEGPGGGVVVAPVDGGEDTLLVLVPGGRVRPHAYTWIGVALAPVGVRTVIPAAPFDLAILAPGRLTSVVQREASDVRTVVVAGHSLGGVVASTWLRDHPDGADALVLMGSYPPRTTDLGGTGAPVLVLAAEFDALATLDELRDGMARLGPRAGLEVVDGAVHAFFGRYGTQRGDGRPTVSRARAESEIAAALEAFVEALRRR